MLLDQFGVQGCKPAWTLDHLGVRKFDRWRPNVVTFPCRFAPSFISTERRDFGGNADMGVAEWVMNMNCLLLRQATCYAGTAGSTPSV